jgi:drug/metabolite transporter (DMT)-like permease
LSSLLLVGGFPLFSSMALAHSEASHGAVILAVLPLATAAAATIVAGERPSMRFWLFAVAGSALVIAFALARSRGAFVPADGLFLLAAVSAAFGYSISGRLARLMSGWEVICWQLVLALPVTSFLLLILLKGVEPSRLELWAVLGLAYVSVFSMYLGFFAWNAGLALGGVARVGQVQLLQVFITLALSAAVLGESLDPVTLIFAVLVVVIVALGRRSPVRQEKAASRDATPHRSDGG